MSSDFETPFLPSVDRYASSHRNVNVDLPFEIRMGKITTRVFPKRADGLIKDPLEVFDGGGTIFWGGDVFVLVRYGGSLRKKFCR